MLQGGGGSHHVEGRKMGVSWGDAQACVDMATVSQMNSTAYTCGGQ